MARGGVLKAIVFLVILILMLSSYSFAVVNETTEDKPEGGGLTKNDEKTNINGIGSLEGKDLSYEWLFNKTTINIGTVADDSLAVIALLGSGQDVSQLIDRIKTRMDKSSGCWPKNGCKVKDTSLATLAMHLSEQDEEAEAGVKWLKNSRIAGLKGGEWWLVIKGNVNEGSCAVSYKGKSKTFNFLEDKIKETGGKYYLNLLQVDPSILRGEVIPTLNVDCSNLAGSIITLLYKPNINTFFIQKSETASNVELKVANVCFGESKGSASCDYESSLYATWVLLEMGESGLSFDEIGDVVYLQSKLKTSNVKDLALLNRLLYVANNVGQSFVKDLSSKQKPGGDWEGDVFTTSLSVLGLLGNSEDSDAVNRGTAYLERRMNTKDGSWDNNVRSTSMALIALNGVDLARESVGAPSVKSKGVTSSGKEDCFNDLDDDGDTYPDCGDSDCEEEKVSLCSNGKIDSCEENVDCGGFCEACGEEKTSDTTTTEECKSDSECDSGEECLSGKCVTKEEGCKTNSDCSASEECLSGKCLPKEQKSYWWLWLLIILLVLFGAFGIFYIKYVKTGKFDLKHLFKRKPKGQTFEEFKVQERFKQATPRQQPQNTRQQAQTRQPTTGQPRMQATRAPVKTKEDIELERSIKEAERLIKGK